MMSLYVGPGECNALFITNAGETHSIQEGYIEELSTCFNLDTKKILLAPLYILLEQNEFHQRL